MQISSTLGQSTMSNGRKKILNPEDLEYLTIDQAASICCVSEERFGKWIAKGLLPVIEINNSRLIRSRDLIHHLIRHNIRIPERLLQGNSKKILFILLEKDLPSTMTTHIIWTLYRLRKHPAFIVDFIECDSNTELKVITFDPDIIFLLKSDADTKASVLKLHRMLGKEITIHNFSMDQPIDIDALLTD
ncbi:MAG: helix-turn-helix domain-containing protein [Desulfobulbus sp.]|nr:helix-turn-helix domain-containing protein [Desulfobulbus sp.]